MYYGLQKLSATYISLQNPLSQQRYHLNMHNLFDHKSNRKSFISFFYTNATSTNSFNLYNTGSFIQLIGKIAFEQFMDSQILIRSSTTNTSQTSVEVLSTMDSLLVFIAIIFMSLIAYVGTLPYRVTAFTQNGYFKAIGNTFAGAVFFNVALLHILPEANEAIQRYFNPQGLEKQVFPLAFLLMIVGFLLIIFLTKVIGGHQHDSKHNDSQQIRQIQLRLIESSSLSEHFISNPEKEQQQVEQSKIRAKSRQILLLTTTIYLHTFFQGISIGVQDDKASLLSTALAIGLHKWADAFSIGMFYKNKGLVFTKAYMLIGIQALLNGVSIWMGWLIQSKGEFLQAVFLSISGGTFLGLSVMHILNEQLNNKKYIWYKFIVMILATILVLLIWVVQQSF